MLEPRPGLEAPPHVAALLPGFRVGQVRVTVHLGKQAGVGGSRGVGRMFQNRVVEVTGRVGSGREGHPHWEPAQIFAEGQEPTHHLFCRWQGNTVELPEEENTPEKRVDRIFAMMDKVRPGQSWSLA